jgi:predicted TPR repeat methyltransferase
LQLILISTSSSPSRIKSLTKDVAAAAALSISYAIIHVLEFGCGTGGTGGTAIKYALGVHCVQGIDISSKIIDIAQQSKAPGQKCQCGHHQRSLCWY